jgi:hypothetical protein
MSKLIGTAPNQVPSNSDLGTMAYQDSESAIINNSTFENASLKDVLYRRTAEGYAVEKELVVSQSTISPGATVTYTFSDAGNYHGAMVEVFGIGRFNGTTTDWVSKTRYNYCYGAGTITSEVTTEEYNIGIPSGQVTFAHIGSGQFKITITNTHASWSMVTHHFSIKLIGHAAGAELLSIVYS